MLAWSEKNRAIGGRPFSLDRYPCMIQIYQDQSDFIVVEKPNQVGASEWLINVALHALDVGAEYFEIDDVKDSLNVGYIFPTWTQLRDFSKDRIRKVARETPYLTELLAPIRSGGLRRESDLGLYFIRDSAWYLRGAHRPDDQLASFPVDILIIDEYDLITLRAAALAEKRLRASPLRAKYYVSKPSLPNMGIDKLFLESDQLQWQICCPNCETWQPPDFWANVVLVENGEIQYYPDWKKRTKAELLSAEWDFACKACTYPMDRCSPGRWEAQNPFSPFRGYRIPGMVAPFVPLLEVVKGSLAEEPDLLLEWYRADLGLPKSPEGGQLSWDELEACKQDYTMTHKARRCTMGVDVGVKLHVRIGCFREDQWQAVFIGTVDEFSELDELMKRYDVRSAVIDALPETRSSRDFCKRWPGRAWMAYYQAEPKAIFVWKDPKERTEAGTVTIARTETMDRVATSHRERLEGLPENAQTIEGFYTQMCAPVKVMVTREKKDGTRMKVSIYLETGPDHFFHASVYERASRERLPPPAPTAMGVSGASSFA